ncbi:ribosomal RNA small subunit methyltransferase A [Candidatus Uhrbacteria bacterium]|nr:ribosomal RNA small subunit methyltransferase A [Candidatus Uhrbacteria bacterium]
MTLSPRAKKSYGQNWLVDETVVKKIIQAAEIRSGEPVLEIGPGTGVLTQALVDAGAQVIAIEADPYLIEPLKERFGDRIYLIQGDALTFPLPPPLSELRWAGHHFSYKLIANIPYNITSDLLRRFLTQDPKPSRMVLMVQKEVADRITAKPPQMSLLSVVCQLYATCARVSVVPRGAFRPIPNVDSAIVQFDLEDPQSRWGIDPESVIELAKLGFSSRRKQLHGNMAGASIHVTSSQVKEALSFLGLDPRSRAEVLTVDQWVQLTHTLNE